MNKKVVFLALTSVLLLFGYLPIASTHVPPARINQIVVATIAEPVSVDPAWAYDTASEELIFNVYDRLISFKVDRSLPPKEQGKTDEFVPSLATEWAVSPDGMTYIFKMRDGVTWHDGTVSTAAQMAANAEYSFERWMIQSRTGGPTWMILEPLLGVYNIELTAWFAARIDNAVESFTNATGSYVQFNLSIPYPHVEVFLTILAQPWSSILSRVWCMVHGDFPGFSTTGYDPAVWGAWNDPTVSPLDDYPTGTGGKVMMGTGPYRFDYWDSGVEWSIVRHADYWGGWPADLPGQGGAHPGYPGSGYAQGWIERATVIFVPEWATRRMMFLAGDADFCYVPRCNIAELIRDPGPPEDYVSGIRCFKDLPMLALDVMFFNFDISTTSPYLGPGFDPANPYVIAENRIPVDFFSDINVRRAFAYSFDYDGYLAGVWHGEAGRPAGPVKEGERYYNPDQDIYEYNLAMAQANFMTAFGGEVWMDGFTFTLTYNSGNEARAGAAAMLEAAVESLNPRFHIDLAEVPWPTYLTQLVSFELTAFVLGWLADFPDPHDNVHPFMHSQGNFAQFQSYQRPTIDDLIELGIETPDGPERQAIYYELQRLYYNEVPSVPLAQPLGRHWERDWIQGWYYNPLYGGSHAVGFGSTAPAAPVLYFYHYWKGWKGDTDKDYYVNIDDLYNVLIGYGMTIEDAMATYGVPAGTDIDHDGWIDLDDIYWVLIEYG